MSTATASTVYTDPRPANNPPCADWCDRHHEPHELVEGTFVCTRVLLQDGAIEVGIQSGAYINDQGDLHSPAADVYTTGIPSDMPPKQAAAVAAALILAAAHAEKTVRPSEVTL